MFKVNISTIIDWKKQYEATGDIKTKVLCLVNKRIVPEKHDLFDSIEQVDEFQIGSFQTGLIANM